MLAMNHKLLVLELKLKNNLLMKKMLCKIDGVDILGRWEYSRLKNKQKVRLYLLGLELLGWRLRRIWC